VWVVPEPVAQSDGPAVDNSKAEPAATTSAPRKNLRDPLASDRPGDELAPDAAIWKLYMSEAKEYDSELVKGRNDNLDTMLIFVSSLG
jgi:hypothetical protein